MKNISHVEITNFQIQNLLSQQMIGLKNSKLSSFFKPVSKDIHILQQQLEARVGKENALLVAAEKRLKVQKSIEARKEAQEKLKRKAADDTNNVDSIAGKVVDKLNYK